MKNKLSAFLANLIFFFKQIRFHDFFKNVIDFIIKFWRKTVLILVLFIVLYYPIGAFITHKIDTSKLEAQNVSFKALNFVATTADLINREVNQRLWTANLPFFFPATILDNMPSFQTGIIEALSFFIEELARNNNDENLNEASELLQYPSNIWIIDFSKSWLPMASTNKKYRLAIRELMFYNDKLALDEAAFLKNELILKALLNAVIIDLNNIVTLSALQIEKGNKRLFDLKADNVFYHNKGKVYGYYIILNALKKDFADIIKARNLEASWDDMLTMLHKAFSLKPLIVINAKADANFVPSHLAGQAFYITLGQRKINQIYYQLRTK